MNAEPLSIGTIVEALQSDSAIREGDDVYRAWCPVCRDALPQLFVGLIDGQLWIVCAEGCTPAEVLAAIGLEGQR